MVVRPIQLKDIDSISKLFSPEYDEYNKTCSIYYLDGPDTHIDADQKYGWGLFINDEIISCMTIGRELPDEPRTWFIGDVYTKTEYRGNKYALKLIKEVMIELDVDYATIGMPEESLVDFYKGVGFEINTTLGRMDYRRK